MPNDDDPRRKDPTEVVGPYARVRIIIAVIGILIGVGVLVARVFLS